MVMFKTLLSLFLLILAPIAACGAETTKWYSLRETSTTLIKSGKWEQASNYLAGALLEELQALPQDPNSIRQLRALLIDAYQHVGNSASARNAETLYGESLKRFLKENYAPPKDHATAGVARMKPDGTLLITRVPVNRRFHVSFPSEGCGDFRPSDPDYKQILSRLGLFKPGSSKQFVWLSSEAFQLATK